MTIKRVAFEFDPIAETGIRVPASRRSEALRDVADFVHESVLSNCGAGRTSVAAGAWKRGLSKEYKKRKAEESSVGFANMELHGDMLDALEVAIKRGRLTLQIEGDQAPKADGHNNHSGDSALPLRQFIPRKDETLTREIWRGVRDILEEYAE